VKAITNCDERMVTPLYTLITEMQKRGQIHPAASDAPVKDIFFGEAY
jgi:hypothetical protein